ncbi:glycosyltransferase [Vibrio vulnificus]|uniref:glycosyltransferase n=1 Tax=Vibrio vulnificus TaxID=672 RepID=UPI003ED9C6EA
MSNVLINGINSKTGGGKSILTNLLKTLSGLGSNHYYVLMSDRSIDHKFSENITIIKVPSILAMNFFAPITYLFFINRYAKKLNCDSIVNLGDLVVRTSIKQVYLFDWAYAVYSDSAIWDNMDIKGKLIRMSKCFLIGKYIDNAEIVIAQTSVTQQRLIERFNHKNVVVIPNAVSLDNYLDVKESRFNKDLLGTSRLKCLYLTHYYQHKNIEIFIDLAKEILKRDLPIELIVTLGQGQGDRADEFISNIKALGLDGVIRNVGSVSMEDVPALYEATDCLLMPTYLESFSGTYVEAMYHRKLILTSDRDFSRVICGESAIYFDPNSVEDILEKICFCLNDENIGMIDGVVNDAYDRVRSMPSWNDVSREYLRLIG